MIFKYSTGEVHLILSGGDTILVILSIITKSVERKHGIALKLTIAKHDLRFAYFEMQKFKLYAIY